MRKAFAPHMAGENHTGQLNANWCYDTGLQGLVRERDFPILPAVYATFGIGRELPCIYLYISKRVNMDALQRIFYMHSRGFCSLFQMLQSI